MARYGAEHKQATRERIVATAGRRLKQDGIDGAGIAVLMADAGLTNGAFYSHFRSKDDLVATVVADQLAAQRDTLAALPPGRAAVEDYVRGYLSPAHRDQRGEGCPSAALLDEIGRCSPEIRQAYATGIDGIVDVVAGLLDPADPLAGRGTALSLVSLLIGAVQLARALPDPAVSAAVLDNGVASALHLLDNPDPTTDQENP